MSFKFVENLIPVQRGGSYRPKRDPPLSPCEALQLLLLFWRIPFLFDESRGSSRYRRRLFSPNRGFSSKIVYFQIRNGPPNREFSSKIVNFRRRNEPQNRAFSSKIANFQIWNGQPSRAFSSKIVNFQIRNGQPSREFSSKIVYFQIRNRPPNHASS